MSSHTFSTEGGELMLVPVPENAVKFEIEENLEGYNGSYLWFYRSGQTMAQMSFENNRICLNRYCAGAKILGEFHPSKNEIDFEHPTLTVELLQSEAAKKWPLAKNPFNGLTSGDEYFNWTIAQSKVLPSKLLVIEIEK